RNAMRSTGPRSAQGKRSASRNALRHGLAIAAPTNIASTPHVLAMARALCRENATPLEYEQALIIAECEIMLRHLQATRVAAMDRNKSARTDFDDATLDAVRHALPELVRLERYERRLLSRRGKAIARLTAASILAGESCETTAHEKRK